MWGKELLEVGLCWRIGNGRAVDIFKDRWIPTIQNRLNPISSRLPVGCKVDSLILNQKWDEALINSTCIPYIAQEILSIPLPLAPGGDKRYWRFDSKGQYSVKDGYKVGMGMYDPPAHQSDQRYLQEWWRLLWSLAVPPKLRIFWWRVIHNLLSTGVNLANHHVPVTRCCPLCRFHEDTTGHALLWCPSVSNRWKGNHVWRNLKICKSNHMLDISVWIKNFASKSDLEEFICQAWIIWGERCRVVHANEVEFGSRPLLQAVDFLSEYNSARKSGLITNNKLETVSPTKWNVPPGGQLRLDVDASFLEDSESCGIGGAIRNHEGNLVAAFGCVLPKPGYVVLGELLAIVEGIKNIKNKGFIM